MGQWLSIEAPLNPLNEMDWGGIDICYGDSSTSQFLSDTFNFDDKEIQCNLFMFIESLMRWSNDC